MADRTIEVMVRAEADTGEAEAALARVQALGKTLSSQLTSGLQGMIFQGRTLESTLKSIALNFSQNAFQAAFQPVEKGLSSTLGGLFGALMPFAKGGVFDGPTAFSFGSGLGVLGEAGPEAVMPLTRDTSGRLGVRAEGRAASVTVNISTPDAASFQRSSQQVAASIARAVARGQRSL